MRTGPKRPWSVVLTGAAAIALTLSLAGPAAAVLQLVPGGSLTVTPDANLVNGQQVDVSATGLTPNTQGAIVECNSDPGQPTVLYQDIPVPVSCSNLFGDPFSFGSTTVQTSPTGTVQATFVVHTGVLGPPVSGTDSAGNDAGADAANYPCPPTAAEQAAGDACHIAFGDLASEAVQENISFGPPITATPIVMVQGGGLEGGDTVSVQATGLAPDSPTLVSECNLTPGEPSTGGYGFGPAIACTSPFGNGSPFVPPLTDSTGAITTDFTLQEGNIGAQPATAAYPCPPSPANVAAGGSCDIVVEDGAGTVAKTYIGLVGPIPTPSLSVSPAGGLLNGQRVTVTGTGFITNNGASLYECNQTPGEPTVNQQGVILPVACSTFFGANSFGGGFGQTDGQGRLSGTFVVGTGTVAFGVYGYPSYLDSAGNDPSTDSPNYPCPPTPAQQAAGGSCVITAVDFGNNVATAPIAFGPPRTFAPSIQVMPVLGSIDLANLSVGTEVDVVGSGFTPDSPASIYECSFTPGGPVDGVNGLPFDCLYIEEAQSLLTDSGGGFSGNGVIGEFYQGYFPDKFSPPPSACATGPAHAAGTCAIVVEDAAGDQARVTIGVSDSS